MNDPSNSSSRRGPDAGEFAARLHHSRSVMDRRRALEREREQAVAEAVRDYWSAWRAISTIEQRRERRIQALRDKVHAISETAATNIAVATTSPNYSRSVRGHSGGEYKCWRS